MASRNYFYAALFCSTLILVSNLGCQKKNTALPALSVEHLELMVFQQSDQYRKILAENAYLLEEDLSRDRSNVAYFQDERDKPWLSIVFKNGGKVYASLRAIKVADAKVGIIGQVVQGQWTWHVL